jgi:uncharacterized phosphosugar-binding protein
MISNYFNKIKKDLDQIYINEKDQLEKAANQVALAIMNNGVIHVFGCGHSHMMAEELFYRAGGLVPVNPILIEPLMLHEGAVRSSQFERKEGYIPSIFRQENISHNDVVIIVSTSGRNPVPIDAALTAKEMGSFVIGLTSFEYVTMDSRHSNQKHLSECVDLAINNHVPKGDAVLSHQEIEVPFTSVSTIYNAAILNAIMSKAIEEMVTNSFQPPLFLSGNVNNADEHNAQLIEKYGGRIPLLKNRLY